MYDIIALAASNGSSNLIDAVAWIGIPLFLAFCGAIWALVKGGARVGHFLTKTEDALLSTAKSNEAISQKLDEYAAKTDRRLSEHDQDLAVIKYAMEKGLRNFPDLPNGEGNRSRRPL